jgi:hypothetical protein
MTKKDKLLVRFLSIPKDFTYHELKTLLNSLGYEESNLGKTSGSRVVFFNARIMHKFKIHKPHPINIIKHYLLEFIVEELKSKNII